MSMDIEALIRDYESAVCRIILYCVAELPFTLGINRTISVLKGSKSTFVIDYKMNDLDTYSLLSTFAAKDLKAIIGTLIEAELLEIEFVSEYENIPILKITEKGRESIAGGQEAGVQFLEMLTDRSVPDFDDFEETLFDSHKDSSKQKAQEAGGQAFRI